MFARNRLWNLGISLLVVCSMALTAVVATANAAGTGAHAKKSAAKTSSATCKTKTKPSGSVIMSDWEFPDTMNPEQTSEAVTAWIENGVFESLYGYNTKAQLYPQMATNIPTAKNGEVSKDGLTYTVHLKPNLHFSNGAQITSADVKFSWQVEMDPATGPYCSGTCDAISRIDTPNKTTMVFHFKTKYAPAVAYAINGIAIWPMSWPGAWANDPHAAAEKIWSDTSYNFENTTYPTDGPYEVSLFSNNDRVVLTPDKYYNNMACGANLSNLIFAYYSSKDGEIAAAAQKQTDVSGGGGGYTLADLPTLQSHKSAFKTYITPSFDIEHLELNNDATYNGKPNPLHNANVRLALALALDKTGLIESALHASAAAAKASVAWSPFLNTKSLSQPFANKAITGQYDPITKKFTAATGKGAALADAKKLLASTPYKAGFTLDFDTTTNNPVRQAQAAVIQQNWKAIGVNLNITYVPAAKLFATAWASNGVLDHGAFQVGMFGYIGEPDPDQWKYDMMSKYCDRNQATHASINQNNACINDALINRDFPAASHTFNTTVRRADYYAIQTEMNKMAYWIPLYYKATISTNDGKVSSFAPNPTQLGSTWNVYAWKTAASS